MANYAQTNKPSKLNLDRSSKYLLPNESFFLLNHEVNDPNNLDVGVPLAANYPACDLELPAGENYCPNTYYCAITNETYSWHYNSNGVHFISRINGNGVCEIVYDGDCLQLSADPKHQITQWRAVLDVDYLCSKVPGGKLKRLVWVDGTDTPIGSLDVEASIATDSFRTPFFDRCANDCANIQLCVPEPEGCLNGEFIPYVDSDKGLSNKLLDKGLKFMYRYIYYDQRASEWSDRSSLYFQDTKGCFDNSEGFARCMKFRIPIGNPMVEKIEFAFSEDGGIIWFVAETIEKYKKYNSAQEYWYQRELSEVVSSSFDEEDCTFEYIFCNDKGRQAVPPTQVSRELNPMPRSAQGLFRTKEAIAFYNYIKGTCPIDKNEGDKFDIQLNCATSNNVSCETKTAKVTVRAIIYNEFFERNGFIFRESGGAGVADDKSDPAWFSSIDNRTPLGQIYTGYGQTFSGKTRNFIAYIDGTTYQGEMEQWRSTPYFNSKSKVGVLSGMSNTTEVQKKRGDILNGNFYYQEYTFIVPKGTKGFVRLTSHDKENGLGANQNTSTQVIGTLGDGFLTTYKGNQTLSNIDQTKKEIYFDTCNGDVDSTNAFIIYDFYNVSGLSLGTQSSAYSGYISTKDGLPVEGLRLYRSGSFETTTDYNGFYAFDMVDGSSSSIVIDIYGEQSCSGGFVSFENFSSQSGEGQINSVDYTIQSDGYNNGFYSIVKVVIKDCNDMVVRGVRVAMSGNKYKVTGTDGIAIFRVRNYVSRARVIKAVVVDKGGCFTLDCSNECNPCMPSTNEVILSSCFQYKPELTIYPTSNVNTQSSVNKQFLKNGGRYRIGFVLEGDCGWLTSAYPVQRNDGYFDIPKVQDTLGYNNCQFSFESNGAKFPPQAKRLKIVRTLNLNPFDIQWIVDSIERTSDGKIKLTIQSLNDYNAQYFFKTNTGYKYSIGDRIEFIKNGDGKVFQSSIDGILNFLVLSPYNDQSISGVTDDTNFFNQLIINDDGKLDDLKEGALIEIQTPQNVSTDLSYFDFCATIPLKLIQDTDGSYHSELSIDSGTFTSFDTFLVSRQIGKYPSQLFESKTPSDFWGTIQADGTGLNDTGKVHFENKYENEKRYPRNISVNSANQLNYFGDIEKTLEAIEQGGIIAVVLKGDKMGLAICENSPFLFQISDQLLRVGSNNVIQATTADNLISNPEVNLRGEYGCQYEDIGSIFFGDGFARWVDSKNKADVIHNYQSARIAGAKQTQTGETETTCASFFKNRLTEKQNFNKTATNDLDKLRFSTGMNKTTGVIYLTLKSLRNAGTNNSSAVYELPNETIMYNPENDSYLGFASFTPEGYAELNLNSDEGCSMLTYQNSVPYIHPVVAEQFNTFYGITCDWLIGAVLNQYPSKIKIPLAFELQSKIMWYIKRVQTGKDSFISEVPPVRVKRNQEGKWDAALLNDVNSRGGLYNGDNARSYFCKMLFCRDNTINLDYGTIDNNKRQKFSTIDEIIIKFTISEQSGFTLNL